MLICPACQGQIRETARYCPHCGHHIDEDAALTVATMPTPDEPETRMPSRRSLSQSGAAAFDYGPLTPGATFAGRYRILALLGRGGMGEVYRADDLTLGQAVALKFLPESLDADPGRLQRFLQEVRLSRQVSHPNVCRVYDVGEADGRHFLSMEFVDGEDLSSLLRRIGRLPPDKAAETARQLCAGLAAAHEKGVLHRDLKPSNIMLDGRGKVRLTDFGLAQIEASGGAAEFAGTPAYMAPEQLDGQPASIKSDLYALGLVIHELFTGKRVFDAHTIDDLRRQHRDVSSRALSSTVRDIDPAVERIVGRCLEKDPARRPTSALGVAAALPGGDPLAAALAAGETPSPELVAAAGHAEGLRPLLGLACLAGVLLALVVLGLVSSTRHLFKRVKLDRPPAVLIERARDVIRRLGYPDPPADSASYLTWDPFYVQHIAQRDRSVTRWAGLETTPVVFLIYRQSPRELVAFTPSGRVTGSQPPEDVSGMASAWIDRQGRLVVFSAEPPQYVESPAPSGVAGSVPGGVEGPAPSGIDGPVPSGMDADWTAAFAEARLDMSQFKPVPPKWVPPMACDRRVAWEGNYPSQPPVPVHIEGASFLGKPVYFNIRGPWDVPSRQADIAPSLGEQIGQGIVFAIILLSAVAAALLARRNWRAGRGDPTGATRLATFVFAVLMIAWAVGADHASFVQNEVPILIIALSRNTLIAVTVWAVYMALEPFVRRRWPHMLITWTRVLSGRVTDPLVGRDVLFGVLAGAITAVLVNLQSVVAIWFGQPPPPPVGGPPGSVVIAILGYGVFQALAALFLLLMLRMIVRKDWIAAAILISVRSLGLLPGGDVLTAAVLNGLAATLAFVVLFRVGLLALTVGTIVSNLLISFPITLDWTVWYAPASFAVLLIVVGLAAAGFYTSLAGRSLFNAALLED